MSKFDAIVERYLNFNKKKKKKKTKKIKTNFHPPLQQTSTPLPGQPPFVGRS